MKEPGDWKRAKRLIGKGPRTEGTQSRREVLGSRNSKRTLFGGIDNLERRRNCLEKQFAVEIVAICGQ